MMMTSDTGLLEILSLATRDLHVDVKLQTVQSTVSQASHLSEKVSKSS